jgi:hypothetical protein
MGIRERLMAKQSLDTSYCLLLEYFKDAKTALLFGYARQPQQLRNLLREMQKNGIEVNPWNAVMIGVYPLGNGMFRYIRSEKCIGPVRLLSTANTRWYGIAKKFGMKAEVIDSICDGNA